MRGRRTIVSATMAVLLLFVLVGSATAGSLGSVRVSPSNINFGKVAVGSTTERAWYNTNNTKMPLYVQAQSAFVAGFGLDSSALTVRCADFTSLNPLPPGATCGWGLTYKPQSAGTTKDTMEVIWSDGITDFHVKTALSGTAS